ncbi:MAG: RNA polymerase sigma factor RpoD/SigA [Candidatus Latescibacteria bacterium]|nr:RNA polymerase sigma factor RpoD/SigA [Candidatus Latescibacterota bacterium]
MPAHLEDGQHALSSYLADITNSQPLSRKRELELAARIKKGDLQARDELVKANLRFVVEVAKGYQNRGLPLTDLISSGNLGLLTAAERFDGSRGFKFISYAVWWVRQAIQQTLAEQSRTVRLPANKLNLRNKIIRASRQLQQIRSDFPPSVEIARKLNLPPAEVEETLLHSGAVLSLDEPFVEGEELSLRTTLADTHQPPPDAAILRDTARAELEYLLQGLNQRELHIIRLYFGLNGTEALTLDQIGKILQVTRERVRQVKKQALGKLRQSECRAVLLALAE